MKGTPMNDSTTTVGQRDAALTEKSARYERADAIMDDQHD